MSFLLSKILWTVFSPFSLLLLALGTGLALERSKYTKTARVLCLFSFFGLGFVAVLPLGVWALIPLENRHSFDPPDPIDGIVIIGGDEKPAISEKRGKPTALDSLRRYIEVGKLAHRYPEAKLVFAGGPEILAPSIDHKDAEIARDIMTLIGVPTERMIFETASRNTYENALFSAKIVRPEKTQNWLLVTSAFHMPRAMGCFKKTGWNVFPAPAGYYTSGEYMTEGFFDFTRQAFYLNLAAREYAGLLSYRILGRIDTLWP